MKKLFVVGLILAPLAHADYYARSSFGDKDVLVMVSYQPATPKTEVVASTEIDNGSGDKTPYCSLEAKMTAGTIETQAYIIDKAGKLFQKLESKKELVLLAGATDYANPDCSKLPSQMNLNFVGQSLNDWAGDIFGQPESTLHLSVGVSLSGVTVKRNEKGIFGVVVDTGALHPHVLNVSGSGTLYYRDSTDDTAATQKDSHAFGFVVRQ